MVKETPMQEWKQRLEVATNVAIILVCLLIAVIGVKKFLLPGPTVNMAGPAKGARIPIAGMDWSRTDRTLVLVLNTHSHYCSDSAQFYRTLLPEASARKVQIVAVFPQPSEESRRYLAGLGLSISGLAIQVAPPGAALARGTPTVILADNRGLVVKSWVGKLSARGEAEVWKAIR